MKQTNLNKALSKPLPDFDQAGNRGKTQARCTVQGTKDFLKGMGLGMIADQLADLKLGELLDTPPPGLDEAVAIGKVGLCL